jgi:hypothetical protein
VLQVAISNDDFCVVFRKLLRFPFWIGLPDLTFSQFVRYLSKNVTAFRAVSV